MRVPVRGSSPTEINQERIMPFRYNIPEKYQKLNTLHLKVIAYVTMLIDHFALAVIYNAILVPSFPLKKGTDMYTLYLFYRFLRGVGRTAFPIFCFLIVEGFFHTRSRAKYAVRLLIFGIVSEVPFDLAIFRKYYYPEYQNVFFTLLLGLLLIWEWEHFKNKWYIQIPLAGILIYAAEFFNTDYGWLGVLLIFIFYLLHEWRTPQVFFGIFPLSNEVPAVLVGYLLLLLYNGKRGRFPKYLGYAIYPVHLLLFYLLSVYLHNGV